MPKILVTPRSVTRRGHPALDALSDAGFQVVFSTPGRQPTEEELLKLLPGCAGYLAGVEPVTARVLDAARDLKVIGRNGVGVGNIDLEAAGRRGIAICPAVGANSRGVAELTFGLMLALVRSIPFSDAAMKSRRWERRKGSELQDRTLGLIGCGMIGRAVAQFALAFGMKVVAFDPYPAPDFQPSEDFSYAPFDDVLARADILSLHCPENRDGTALIGSEQFEGMKDGVYLVNTARGSLLDCEAVLDALESGKVSGLAVDVFDTEPPSDWRLVENSRVIASPHIGGFTEESVGRAVSAAVDGILQVLGKGA
jgi:phosphoglycerate dehydrogenase-like enzyme